MGSRTPDLLIANETLYQLSYDPKPVALKINQPGSDCNAYLLLSRDAKKAGKAGINICQRGAFVVQSGP